MRGYLTIAAGGRPYLEMAVDMALSLREHTRLPVALGTDPFLRDLVEREYPQLFDHVTLVPERFRDGRALKYGAAEASPFEETVFVDADCLVLGALDDTFGILERTDVALLGEHLTEDDDVLHHGHPVPGLIRSFGLPTYLKSNSGIFAFRRGPALDFMEACLDCYVRELRPRARGDLLRARWLGDEIAFGVIGGRRGAGVLGPPAPMYWPAELAELDPARPQKPLMHLIHPLPEAALSALLDATAARRRRARIGGDARAHWVRRQAKVERDRRWGALARRLGLR